MTRPDFAPPPYLSADLQARMIASARRKAVYVAPDGRAFWFDDVRRAEHLAATNGGTYFPPVH